MSLVQAYREHCRLNAFETDDAQLEAVDVLEQFMVPRRSFRLGRKVHGRGLYLWGPVGRGKTMLMDLLYEQTPGEKRRVHFHELMREIRERLAELSEVNPMRRIASEIAPPGTLLCIDEVHVSDLDNGILLEVLLKELVRSRTILVSTSNFPPHLLYPVVTDSTFGLGEGKLLGKSREEVMRLLDDHFTVVQLSGSRDFRTQDTGSGENPVSTVTDNDVMNQLFAEYAGVAATPLPMRVGTSSLVCRGETDQLIWFDFDELCNRPCAYWDYLDLVGEKRRLLLSDVSIRSFDAARRFCWLIEICYDRRIALDMTSPTPLVNLFDGLGAVPSQVAREYERVVSRVTQMTRSRIDGLA